MKSKNRRLLDEILDNVEFNVYRFGENACEYLMWSRISRATVTPGFSLYSDGPRIYTTVDRERVNLRRLLYENEHGAIPDGKDVSSSCTVEKYGVCINPDHLVLVDRGSNRKRIPDKVVAQIKADDERPAKLVAAEYGVSVQFVYMLRKGQRRLLTDMATEENNEST